LQWLSEEDEQDSSDLLSIDDLGPELEKADADLLARFSDLFTVGRFPD